MSRRRMDEAPAEPPSRPPRGLAAGAAATASLAAALAGVALTALVLTTDPNPARQELFAGLVLVAGTGVGWATVLLFAPRGSSPVADVLRGFRRGLLFGLACAGITVLQFNRALTPPNAAFLLLVLLIVEMVFLARRQHPI